MRTVAPPQRSRIQIRLAGVQCNASFLFSHSRCLIAEPFKRSFPNGRHSLTRWLAGRPRGQLYETQACLPHLLHRLLSLPASSLSFSQAVILFFLAIFHFSRLSPTPPSLSGLLVSFFSPPSPFPGSAPSGGRGGNQAGGGCEGSRVESICLCRGWKLNKGPRPAGSAGAQYEETGGGRREKGSVGYGRWSWKGQGGNLREKKTKWSFRQALPNFGGDKEGKLL